MRSLAPSTRLINSHKANLRVFVEELSEVSGGRLLVEGEHLLFEDAGQPLGSVHPHSAARKHVMIGLYNTGCKCTTASRSARFENTDGFIAIRWIPEKKREKQHKRTASTICNVGRPPIFQRSGKKCWDSFPKSWSKGHPQSPKFQSEATLITALTNIHAFITPSVGHFQPHPAATIFYRSCETKKLSNRKLTDFD